MARHHSKPHTFLKALRSNNCVGRRRSTCAATPNSMPMSKGWFDGCNLKRRHPDHQQRRLNWTLYVSTAAPPFPRLGQPTS
eukprot:1161259-Pelagomonas_calceolata.AAC.5